MSSEGQMGDDEKKPPRPGSYPGLNGRGPRTREDIEYILREVPDHVVTDSDHIRFATAQAMHAARDVAAVLERVRTVVDDAAAQSESQDLERRMHLETVDAAKIHFATCAQEAKNLATTVRNEALAATEKVDERVTAFRAEANPLLAAQSDFRVIKKVAAWGMGIATTLGVAWVAFEHIWAFAHQVTGSP